MGKECGASGGSKPVNIGDLCMGIISCIHRLVGAPIKCPPSPPISLQHSVNAHVHTFQIWPHFCIWMHLSVLASHLGGLFHHKPALVASVILWLEYLLCAHHLPSTSGNIPHCTRTRPPAPILPSLPHQDMPIHPCFPLPALIS